MLKTKDGYAKVIGTSYQGSSDYLLLSNGDSKAISSLSVSYATSAGNADKLDGYHENSFLRYRGDTSTDQEATLWSQIGIKKYTGALPDGLTGVYNYGSVISLPCDSSRFEIYASHQSSSGNGLYYRSGWNSDKKSWLKFIDSSNIGSQSVNYANSAGNSDTVDGEHASNFVRAGVIDTDVTDLNALDTYSFIKSVNSEVADHSPKGNTGWYNVIQLVHRNGSGDGPGYIGQIALGMTTNTNDMFFRGKRTDSWKTVIHSGNIADQSVKYATNSGNADTVDGTHLNGIFTAFGNNAHNITATIGGVTKSFLVNWAADSDKLDGYHANTVYNAPSFQVHNSNTSNTYILLATITISGTSLSCSEFTILFQNRECLDNSSFILSGAIRRNSTTNVQATLSYITLHTEIPRNIYLRSNDGVTFMVYIQSAASAWTTYYRAIPIVDSGNIIYSNTGTTSPISGSVLNITATKGGNVNYANSAENADKLDGYHASGLLTTLSNSNNGISITVGGTTKSISNISVNYAKSAGSVAWNNVTGRPSTFTPSAHTHKWADITDHITKLSQLTNDKGFVTGSVSGNTITINDSSTTWSDTWRPITDDYELGESDTSLSSLGSLTLYNDLLGTIPNPTDYYWANNKISSTSKTDAEVRVKNLGAGCSTTIENTIMATNWLRAKGSTGIYFQDHGGGLYMSDDTWIRTWAGKALQVDNIIRSTDFHTTYYANNIWTITSAARLENHTTLIYGFNTSSNYINTYLRGQNVTLQVKKDTSINYNAFQVTADETRCFNYFNMKGGATVSKGNFTVQNNTYLAQEKDAKVSIGNIISDTCKLGVDGGIEATKIMLWAADYKSYKQPVCIVCGTFRNNSVVNCNTKVRIISNTKGYCQLLFDDILEKWDFDKLTLLATSRVPGIISGQLKKLNGSLGMSVTVKADGTGTSTECDFHFMIWSWDN